MGAQSGIVANSDERVAPAEIRGTADLDRLGLTVRAAIVMFALAAEAVAQLWA